MSDVDFCPRCGRRVESEHGPDASKYTRVGTPAKVVVQHSSYGCDTGCCGHRTVVLDNNDHELGETWAFDHPYGVDQKTWINDFAGPLARHLNVPIDHDGSDVSDD